jgi:hypothetical protein
MTKTEAKVFDVNLKNQRRKIHDVCDIVKLSYGMYQQILPQKLNMWHNTVKFVIKLLSNGQKEHRVAVCFKPKEQTGNNPNFISPSLLVMNFGFMDTTLRPSKWKTPNSQQAKKARQLQNNVK